jgi:hypothetical protein
VIGPTHAGERERVIKAAAGITFSLLLTDSGKGTPFIRLWLDLVSQLGYEVFAFGSGEKGQLGNGRTGEHIVTGNKTAFDIEPQPSYVCLCLSQPLSLTFARSFRERVGKQKNNSDCMWSATQSSSGRGRVSISILGMLSLLTL